MSCRFLLAMIMALALALGPLAMRAGEAVAAAPAHHGQMAATDHCDKERQPDRQGDEADAGCCFAGCMAIAALPAPAAEAVAPAARRDRPVPDRFQTGHWGETATPPPRRA